MRPREWRRAVPEKVAIAPASSLATSPTTASSETGSAVRMNAPPETGGISATTSPSASSVAGSAYSLFTA